MAIHPRIRFDDESASPAHPTEPSAQAEFPLRGPCTSTAHPLLAVVGGGR
jgi:hypothetical protein